MTESDGSLSAYSPSRSSRFYLRASAWSNPITRMGMSILSSSNCTPCWKMRQPSLPPAFLRFDYLSLMSKTRLLRAVRGLPIGSPRYLRVRLGVGTIRKTTGTRQSLWRPCWKLIRRTGYPTRWASQEAIQIRRVTGIHFNLAFLWVTGRGAATSLTLLDSMPLDI